MMRSTRERLMLFALSVYIVGQIDAERHRPNGRARKRHKWDDSRRLVSTPEQVELPSTSTPTAGSEVDLEQEEPDAYLRAVPQRVTHLESLNVPITRPDYSNRGSGAERSHRTLDKHTGLPHSPDNYSVYTKNRQNPENDTEQDDFEYWTDWLDNNKWKDHHPLLSKTNSKTTNEAKYDDNYEFIHDFGKVERNKDYREDVPAKTKRFPVTKELSSSQLFLLVAGLFFGSIILCSVCAYTRGKAKENKKDKNDSHEAVSLCPRQSSSQANSLFCPRPLYPQAYPGQTMYSLDNQPYLEIKLEETEGDPVNDVISEYDNDEGSTINLERCLLTTVEINTQDC